MSFSVVEGSVEIRPVLLKLSRTADVDSVYTISAPFSKSADITRVYVFCSSGPIDFSVKIYSSSNKTDADKIFQAESNGDRSIDICVSDIPFVSQDGNIYVEISHNDQYTKSFQVIIYGKSSKYIIL